MRRLLDAYSDWADRETGVVFRIGRWRYVWLNMDTMSALLWMVVVGVMWLLYGAWHGLVTGSLAFWAALVLLELGFWRERIPHRKR